MERRHTATHLEAYAQVEPIRTIDVDALIGGTVSDFQALPGEEVRAGHVLAHISGPDQMKALEKAKLEVLRARAALKLAKQTLHNVKQTYPGISTRQQVDNAQAALSEAQAQLTAVRAQVQFLRQASNVKAPTDGSILATFVANGDHVIAESRLLRIQPSHQLWLRAVFYTEEAALHPGMQGVFQPAAGGQPIPVRLRTIISPLQSDGGRGVACVPVPGTAPNWSSGEVGLLRLQGPSHNWAAVPTSALIIDQGRWWVVVHGPHGDHKQPVVPGPQQGSWTLIQRGLQPGEIVAVSGAYLRFHRDFSKQYQPPD